MQHFKVIHFTLLVFIMHFVHDFWQLRQSSLWDALDRCPIFKCSKHFFRQIQFSSFYGPSLMEQVLKNRKRLPRVLVLHSAVSFSLVFHPLFTAEEPAAQGRLDERRLPPVILPFTVQMGRSLNCKSSISGSSFHTRSQWQIPVQSTSLPSLVSVPVHLCCHQAPAITSLLCWTRYTQTSCHSVLSQS